MNKKSDQQPPEQVNERSDKSVYSVLYKKFQRTASYQNLINRDQMEQEQPQYDQTEANK